MNKNTINQEIAVALIIRSDMMDTFFSTGEQMAAGTVEEPSRLIQELFGNYRIQMQMNFPKLRTHFSVSRWQCVLSALTASARSCISYSSISAIPADKLTVHLRKHLNISMVCSAVSVRVRSMIT